MPEHEHTTIGQAFRQFQYLTVPLHVSSDYKNTVLRKVLDERFNLGGKP